MATNICQVCYQRKEVGTYSFNGVILSRRTCRGCRMALDRGLNFILTTGHSVQLRLGADDQDLPMDSQDDQPSTVLQDGDEAPTSEAPETPAHEPKGRKR